VCLSLYIYCICQSQISHSVLQAIIKLSCELVQQIPGQAFSAVCGKEASKGKAEFLLVGVQKGFTVEILLLLYLSGDCKWISQCHFLE